MKAISSEIFTVSNSTKTLIAEYSDLNDKQVGRTIEIVSHKTGASTFWDHAFCKVDKEDEIVYDAYTPTKEAVRLYPQLKGYVVKIYND